MFWSDHDPYLEKKVGNESVFWRKKARVRSSILLSLKNLNLKVNIIVIFVQLRKTQLNKYCRKSPLLEGF